MIVSPACVVPRARARHLSTRNGGAAASEPAAPPFGSLLVGCLEHRKSCALVQRLFGPFHKIVFIFMKNGMPLKGIHNPRGDYTTPGVGMHAKRTLE